MDHLIIVDCQYDFIDGSLACSHSREAVRNIIAFANANDVECMYTSDWHSKTNKSFKINGGIWPVHCVAGSRGAEVSDEFNQMNEGNRPGKDNIFYKGKMMMLRSIRHALLQTAAERYYPNAFRLMSTSRGLQPSTVSRKRFSAFLKGD